MEIMNMVLIFQGILAWELVDPASKDMTNLDIKLMVGLWRHFPFKEMVLISNMDFQIIQRPDLQMLMHIYSLHRVL